MDMCDYAFGSTRTFYYDHVILQDIVTKDIVTHRYIHPSELGTVLDLKPTEVKTLRSTLRFSDHRYNYILSVTPIRVE